MKLTEVERAALAAIKEHPGLLASELHQHVAGIVQKTGSALTSRLIRLKKVNRAKVPHTATFRYYPVGHPLPADVDAWSNKLLRRRVNGHAGEASATVEAPVPAHGGVLLTVEFGNNESATLTIEQARRVYEQLAGLFAGR